MRLTAHVLAAAVAAAVFAEAGALPAKYLAAKDIQRGMKGYGLSVFQGTKIERFDVEVVGVLRNALPKQDMVLARMSGAGLEKTGIIAGMSGSPIYLKVGDEFKLAGAVAYGWGFPKEPICGITPIENMYGVFESAPAAKRAAPEAERVAGQLDAPVTLGDQTFADVRVASGPSTWARTLSDTPTLYRLRTPLFIGGVSEAAFALARQELEPLGFIPMQGAGGGAGPEEAKDVQLEPGSALAVRMVEGDIEMEGVGTVTEVIGDRILGFGHPMMGEGQVSIPMATGVVHLCFASLMRSIKLASALRTVGSLTADEQAAVMGKIGEMAPMIPVEVRLQRADVRGEETLRCRVLVHHQMTARVLPMVLANGLLIRGGFSRDNTIHLRATLTLAGRPPLVIENVYSAINSQGALMDALRDVSMPVSLLLNNPFGQVGIERLEASFDVRSQESLARLESVRVERSEYHPGETVKVFATLRSFKKEPAVETLELKIPEDYPEGNTMVMVCDTQMSRNLDQQDNPSRYVPRDLDQLVEILREQASRRRLVIRMRLPDSGVAVKGVEMPSLPASMLAVIDSARVAGLTPARKSIKAQIETPYVVSGSEAVNITVRPREFP